MKHWSKLFLLIFLASSCSSSSGTNENTADNYPQDLEGKKELLRQKRAELKDITAVITQLEDEITALDPDKTNNARLVTTQKLSIKNFKRFVEVQGVVDAEDLVAATSESPGRIISLTVEEGDRINRGQLIAKLDMEQLNKQMAEIQKSLELAKTVYERQDRLWKQNIGSEIQYLEAKNNKERLEKSLETLEFQMTKAEVYAPVNGVVERVLLHSGEFASPGMPIVQILNTNKLKVVADVPETLLKAVRLGAQVKVEFPALSLEQNTRINEIGRTIDASNRTFKVETSLSKTSNLIKPNLLAIVHINDYSVDKAITVPLEAVLQELSGKDYVFVKQDGERGPVAKKVIVETGESYNGEILITNGLEAGAEVIIEGARDLNENERIQIFNS